MSFKCQEDSYLEEYKSIVKDCISAEYKVLQDNGKVENVSGFDVILEETILFPEGGGQPHDCGSLNGEPVLKVTRKGGDALHFVRKVFEVNEDVVMKVDWERRFDHMQQHTGQHLITAVTDQMYDHKTTSWNLGKNLSFIELDTPANNLGVEKLKAIEDNCNDAIRKRVSVNVIVTETGSKLLENVRARGLPDDHVGPVRIIELNGIDSNMCCGTHVTNLAELMAVKLLYVEKGKKGKSNLYFIVGNRVLNFVDRSSTTDKLLTKLLKCGINEHTDAVDRTLKQLKVAHKNNILLLREIAVMEAQQFTTAINNGDKIIVKHRKEGNNEYMNIIANQLDNLECFMFLTVGEEKGEGLFLLSGNNKFIENCGDEIVKLIDGKGARNGTRMQGKAKKLQNSNKVKTLIEEFIKAMQI